MEKTLAEIAEIVDGELVGDANLVIKGINSIEGARQGEITFVASSKYISLIKKTKASAIIVPRDLEVPGKSIIRTSNPSLGFSKIASFILKEDAIASIKGIHKTAIIDECVVLGENVAIGPHVVIESRAKIGRNTVINAGCYVGAQTVIGNDCLIRPNVTICERSQLGNRVIIHSGTVIGSDGFGFVQVDGIHEKIPQIGIVVIEDDVEIGANVTIDRARFDRTFIGRGAKIDNLVQIGHNAEIGERCILISQVGISGTTKVGKNSILAGQVGVVGHITIGEGTVVAAKSAVFKSLPPFGKFWGIPAKPHHHAKRVNACVQRLPGYVKVIQELKKKVESLEREVNTKDIK